MRLSKFSALAEAKGLIEPGDTEFENPEYIRGMCELIASMWPDPGASTADTATEIGQALGVPDIYAACDKKANRV